MAIKKTMNHEFGFSFDYFKPSPRYVPDFSANTLWYEIEPYKSQAQRNQDAKPIVTSFKRNYTIQDIDFSTIPEGVPVEVFFAAIAYAHMKTLPIFAGYQNDLDEGETPLLAIDPDHPDYVDPNAEE